MRGAQGERSPLDWDVFPVAAGAGATLGLSAAVLLGLRAYRQRPRRPPAELLAGADETGAPVRPVALLVDVDGDPHDIRFAERLAGALLRRAGRAGLGEVRVISATVGSPAPVLVLAAPLADRAPLEAVLRAATDLAHRIEVSSTTEPDLVVRLEGIRPQTLERVAARARPLLLCAGLLPDRRPWLVGWDALSHLLVASEPGTTQARAHLAAMVASLVARRPPDRLRLYTLAAPDDPLGQLASLPHQAAVVDPADAAASARVLASLRDEVDRRLATVGEGSGSTARWPELVVVLAELGSVVESGDLAYLLAHGSGAGLRVLAATADAAVGRGPLVAPFAARFVFGLDDEELSMALLGTPWALTLNGPWRLLARLGHRAGIEISAARLEDAARQELLAVLAPVASGVPAETSSEGNGTEDSAGSAAPAADGQNGTRALADGVAHRGPLEAAPATPVDHRGATEPTSSADAEPTPAAEVEPPPAVARLSRLAPLVVLCSSAKVWHRGRPLALEPSKPLELLLRLAMAPALPDGAGSLRERLLAELWRPNDGDRSDRKAGRAWLRSVCRRLEAQLARASRVSDSVFEGLVLVDETTGTVALDPRLAISDVQAFVAAARRAATATGTESRQQGVPVSKEIFAAVDAVVFRSVWHWAKRRHPHKNARWVRQRYFRSHEHRQWVFFGTVAGRRGLPAPTWLFSALRMPIRRHTKVQQRANPYDPAWEPYFEKRLSATMETTLAGVRRQRFLWEEQGGHCPVCTRLITPQTGWHAHHLVWRCKGGGDQAANQVLLHPSCHTRVHSQRLAVVKPRPVRGDREARAG